MNKDKMTETSTEKKIQLEEEIEAYLYTPTLSYKGGIVLCTDIFGFEGEGSRARASFFAENGYICILPDCLGKDPLTHERLTQENDALSTWLLQHPPTGKKVQTALCLSVSYLEQKFSLENSTIFMVGVCFGGKALLHALSTPSLRGKLGGGMIAHGSFMQPFDLIGIEAPLVIFWAEKDTNFDYKPFMDGVNELQISRKAEGKPPLCGSDDRFKLEIVPNADHGFWVESRVETPAQAYVSKKMLEWLVKFGST